MTLTRFRIAWLYFSAGQDVFFSPLMGHPRPLLSFIFGIFKQTLQSYNNICEKCPSSIRYRDSNPRPLEVESPPITTRPGLPPIESIVLFMTLVAQHCLSFFKLRQNFVWHCHSSICNALPRYTQNYCQYANWQVVGTNHQFVYHFTSAIPNRSLYHTFTEASGNQYKYPKLYPVSKLDNYYQFALC